jgi:hypothetical protein
MGVGVLFNPGSGKGETPDLGSIPLYFIPNQGQVDENVRFYAKTTGYSLWMTDQGLVFQWPRFASGLAFTGTDKNPRIEAVGITDHKVNIFKGRDRSKWKVGIPTSQAVLYKSVYKHIDLKVYGAQKEVEYDWIVKPGGEPGRIGFTFQQAKHTAIDDNGNLVVETGAGKMVHKKPVSYQVIDGERVAVETAFVKKRNNGYGFRVGRYDGNHELVIDPLVLVYGSYLGGKAGETIEDMAVDGEGNVYLVGVTSSRNFPLMNDYQGVGDTFIFKLQISSDGSSRLKYSTFYGGGASANHDRGHGIAVDGEGMIYVTGSTRSTNLPRVNYYQRHLKGIQDAFVVKLDPSKTDEQMLAFASYFGGSSFDSALDIAVDDNGNAYITGTTMSHDLPTKKAFRINHGSGIANYSDAFITKLDTTKSGGDVLVYSSYIASDADDSGRHIALDNNGNAYVSGNTTGRDFTVKKGFQSTCSDSGRLLLGDVFLVRVDTGLSWGNSLVYSTYLGGIEADSSGGVAADNDGNAYITGFTRSKDFPVRGAYQGKLKWGQDAFVSKIDTNASGDDSLVYSTFLGNDGYDEEGTGIAVNGSGHAYVTGNTDSKNFPILDPLFDSPGGGARDAFLTKLNASGSALEFSTYVGGDQLDYSSCIQLDNQGNIYIAGRTLSTEFPVTPGAFQSFRDITWNYDGFILKIEETDTSTPPAKYAKISLDREKLEFGACTSGQVTGAQSVNISNRGEGTLDWTMNHDMQWLTCGPDCGVDNGTLRVSVNPAGLAAGTYTGNVTVSSPNAFNSPKTIEVTLKVYDAGHPAAPFGSFDSPSHGSTVIGSIPVTGWALDNIAVADVKIYRAEGARHVYVGDAVFVEGARPDVEETYRAYPNSYKGGWGYMLLTNFLPGGGNRAYTLLAKARDLEGNEVTLGSKTITCDNANAIKPFGAIDTPLQGDTVSGNKYVNFGWVLTPQPDYIPIDGSTISVWVDGINLGHPVYNQYRSDIATLFPGYANSDGAVGYFYLDTTGLANGLHTIQWVATDSGGDADGIGSRYFTVRNNPPSQPQSSQSTQEFERLIKDKNLLTDTWTPVRIAGGLKEIFPDEQGIIKVDTKELGCIELHLAGGGTLDGRMMVDGRFKPLPTGSSLDRVKGIFRWQPGAGFLGRYRLVFVGKDRTGTIFRKDVVINIGPKF